MAKFKDKVSYCAMMLCGVVVSDFCFVVRVAHDTTGSCHPTAFFTEE